MRYSFTIMMYCGFIYFHDSLDSEMFINLNSWILHLLVTSLVSYGSQNFMIYWYQWFTWFTDTNDLHDLLIPMKTTKTGIQQKKWHQLEIWWSQIKFTGDTLAEPVNGYLRPSNQQLMPWNFQIQYSYLHSNAILNIKKCILAYPWV